MSNLELLILNLTQGRAICQFLTYSPWFVRFTKKLSAKSKPYCLSSWATSQAKIHFSLLVSRSIFPVSIRRTLGPKLPNSFEVCLFIKLQFPIPLWITNTIVLWQRINFHSTPRKPKNNEINISFSNYEIKLAFQV